MSFLNYDDGLYKYQLTFNAPLNVITGDSSTGKTALVREVSRHKNSLTSDMSIIFNPSLDVFETAKENSMLILDSDDYEDSSSVELFKAISKSQRNDLVIVVLGRKYLNLLSLSIQNVFKLEVIKGITKNVQMYPELYMQSTAPFKQVVVEDSKSGFNFYKSIFDNTITSDGNSNILDYAKPGNLLIFDTVGFGAYINKLINITNLVSGISYVGWPCFEGFILENVFNQKLEVPCVINIEKEIYKMLKEINPTYNKSFGCTGSACGHCDLNCKQYSLRLLSKTKYSYLIDLYQDSCVHEDPVVKCLRDLNYPEEWYSTIKNLLPENFIDEECVRDTVLYALKTKGLID